MAFKFLGSSTACLGIFDKESGLLQTANLGDSGFCIFRNGQTFFKSKEQYKDVNVPFQVGVKEIIGGKSIPHGNRYNIACQEHMFIIIIVLFYIILHYIILLLHSCIVLYNMQICMYVYMDALHQYSAHRSDWLLLYACMYKRP